MTFSIFESGNLVVSFDEEAAAQAALERIAEEAPDSADLLLLVAFDDEGKVVGEAMPGQHIAV